ncbi:MAG: YciI family protein [Myxococcales bacterium]|nr:MAG: YciI family protein [Myxococcales bacterium]
MRVMVIVKANKSSEAGKLPTEKDLTAMMKYNEELVKAGMMLAGEGLHPSVKGKRVVFGQGKPTAVDGPFAETKELVAGFWLWQVKSIEEAVEWVKRMPQSEDEDGLCNVEIRPVFEADDFGENLTPETRAKEEELRRLTSEAKH